MMNRDSVINGTIAACLMWAIILMLAACTTQPKPDPRWHDERAICEAIYGGSCDEKE